LTREKKRLIIQKENKTVGGDLEMDKVRRIVNRHFRKGLYQMLEANKKRSTRGYYGFFQVKALRII